MKDYYAILGIAPAAEEIVIRAAWKALAQRYHPDRRAGDVAQTHARMAEINEAYNVLSNPAQRESYDKSREDKNGNFGAGIHKEKPDPAANSFDQLEKDCASEAGFQSNFGNNPEIIAFARQLMFEGNMAAAKALNDSIRELSSDVPADWIIKRICEDFNIETKEMWKRRLRREAKARENAVWEKVREKTRGETAREQDTVAPDPASPSPAGILKWQWQGSFLMAVAIVVLFVVIVIWLFM